MDEKFKNKILSLKDVEITEKISFDGYMNKATMPKPHKLGAISVSDADEQFLFDVVVRSTSIPEPDAGDLRYVCAGCLKKTLDKPDRCKKCANEIFDEEGSMLDVMKVIIEEECVDSQGGVNSATRVAYFKSDPQKAFYDLVLGGRYVFNALVKIMKTKNKINFYLEVISYVKLNDGLDSVVVSADDKERVKVFTSRDDFLPKLNGAVFGTDLFGLDRLQEAILLQMVSSPKVYGKKVLRNRGNLMILFVGSPGKGKSQLLKRAAAFFPKSRYATGSGSTAIGLVASVNKDERVGDYVLSPGSVALCHPQGIACIDELDKVNKDDLTKLNTMMDSLVIPIDKANVHRRLPADVSILAAMNPKYGNFDEHETPYDQIKLSKDFIDRFDLIMNIDYFIGKDSEQAIAEHSLNALSSKEEVETLSADFIKKYFALARSLPVKLSKGCADHMKKEYFALLKKSDKSGKYYSSPRILDNLYRLVCAYSRLRLSVEPDYSDVKSAIELLTDSLKSMGVYNDSQGLDFFKTEHVEPKSNKDKMRAVRTILKTADQGMMNVTSLQENFMFEDFDEIIQKMKMNGDIFEPRRGYVKLC
jgi:replicative DNA helicase Mcm